MVAAVAFEPLTFPPVDMSASLPVRAAIAFEAFSDVIHTPRWFRSLRDARVIFRDPAGRATRVHFTYETPPLVCEYALDYRYNANDFAVTWTTDAASAISLRGEARFVPISSTTSLMTYRLERTLPTSLDALNAAMTEEAGDIVTQFCAHLTRIRS